MLIPSSSPLHGAFLAIANLLIPLSIFIFATGFFPHKPFLPGLAQYEDLEYGPPPAPHFDRLVFMVVDALRSDFVYATDSGFAFTQSLIRQGHALPFTANARSPTITMPRIKAITTGSIPSFLDVILNFDEADTSATLAAQDTWLAQMKAKGTGKLTMYGDDTWLKLFPSTFDRADGTSSFFVSDFTEVDNNVTRHISSELENDDWSTMVLHYLGLDHIGHKAGPASPNMIPKQQEMDGIVEQLYTAIRGKEALSSTLLVLIGDHGMNDAGNHGASSPGETSPALVFISPKLEPIAHNRQSPLPFQEDFKYYARVEQSDLAPTLGALLGFPIPQNSLGAFIADFLPLWPKGGDQIQLLLRNSRQILKVITAPLGDSFIDSGLQNQDCENPADDALDLACEWRAIEERRRQLPPQNDKVDQAWVTSMSKWLERAGDLMSSMASNYDVSRLVLGQVLAALSVLATILLISPAANLMPLLAAALLYGIMMFASSYVEEEQHFWYWVTSAWLGGLAITHMRQRGRPILLLQSILAFLGTRIIRGWNQTGQKHAGEADIVKTFLASDPALLWCLIGLTYSVTGVQIYRRLPSVPRAVAVATAVALVGTAASFKLAFTHEDAPELVSDGLDQVRQALHGLSLVTRARLVFTGLAVASTYGTYRAFAKPSEAVQVAKLFHSLYTLLAITQSRTTNIPIFLFFALQEGFLNSLGLSVASITTSSILLQHMSFFAFGGTNAISSVDLSSAYNGVSGFNVVAVGILTFVSNWAGPIYWASATNLLLIKYRQTHPADKSVFTRHVAFLTLFVSCGILSTMAACTVLRTHLFIWTVFSPKYLYCMAWGIGQHLAINVIVAGMLQRLVLS
ncbi:GPI ethanolamine phosphate transferase [Plectosphaerella plurivora]|uniref:GPI ethanolamine phosphate transferase 2 n=1 Tax=Plectosphaerella plurivora TaxID=936078 RepID=A0A9P9A7P2_9PEZI|nr:GPI ethanolamine phosphate transferase [Plectosphaerella plurivora]